MLTLSKGPCRPRTAPLCLMKEPDYVMKMMATGGALMSDASCRKTTRRVDGTIAKFAYTLPFDWHFRYRHEVDDHNNLRHAVPSLEETWLTLRWVIRVFTFILAVTEVNVYLVLKFFVFVGDKAGDLEKYLEFRRLLAWMFIDNPYMPLSEEPSDDPFLAGARCHDIGSAPAYASGYVTRE